MSWRCGQRCLRELQGFAASAPDPRRPRPSMHAGHAGVARHRSPAHPIRCHFGPGRNICKPITASTSGWIPFRTTATRQVWIHTGWGCRWSRWWARPSSAGPAGANLSNLGLQELAAMTPEQFIEIAINLAKDLPRLSQLRSTLRERLQKSPLMDAPRFARNMEAAYGQMWRDWCASDSSR